MSTFNFTSYFSTFNFDILLLLIQLTLLTVFFSVVPKFAAINNTGN